MQPARVPSIVVHGGAGADPADADEFRAGVRGAVLAGWTVLGAGGSALGGTASTPNSHVFLHATAAASIVTDMTTDSDRKGHRY